LPAFIDHEDPVCDAGIESIVFERVEGVDLGFLDAARPDDSRAHEIADQAPVVGDGEFGV
jgi:hypothetical protein